MALKCKYQVFHLLFDNVLDTGKSMSEALILESLNPQYDERLFIEFPKNTRS